MKLKFTKMQSLGNDFIVIDDRKAGLRHISRLSEKLCNRRFGAGADQLLLLCKSRTADYKMRVFNADGSEVEMCGNGIRCLGSFIWEKIRRSAAGVTGKKQQSPVKPLAIETQAGVILLYKARNLIKVDMGEPAFSPERIPVRIKGEKQMADRVFNYPLKVRDKTFRINCVSMGNPHAVIVVKDVHAAPVGAYGSLIENHACFPRRINVEFIQVRDRSNINMRVWERGAGETLACGTGASAAGVASHILGLTGRSVHVHLPGGKLSIQWSAKDNHVYMTGPAEKVFEGVIET